MIGSSGTSLSEPVTWMKSSLHPAELRLLNA
jgi:hypothetical protein